MMENIFGKPPKIVRHVGDLKSAEVDGKPFYPSRSLYVNEHLYKCIEYGNHFVFRDARRKGWTLFCTCGSPAAILGYDAYKYGGSNEGQLIGCLFHAGGVTGVPGRHADGSQ